MVLKYEPFSMTIASNQPLKNMTYAENAVLPYFIMSTQYHDTYYVNRPEGDTIYYMDFKEGSLLFYFSARPRSYRINGFYLRPEERKKAWISMISMIQMLRKYPFTKETMPPKYDGCFLDNVADFHDATLNELQPFSFIISALPTECFPKCENMRIFNGHHIDHVEKNLLYISRQYIEKTTIPLNQYDRLSSIFWRPPIKRGKNWYFEYYTGKIIKRGRNNQEYEVIQKETVLPGPEGCCSYGDLVREVKHIV